jgi:hypothetical protein
MSFNEGTVYMIRDQQSDDWVSPKPASEVIIDSVLEATDLSADDIASLDTYIDSESLREVVVNGTEESVTFTIEGHDVTVTADSAVSVDA